MGKAHRLVAIFILQNACSWFHILRHPNITSNDSVVANGYTTQNCSIGVNDYVVFKNGMARTSLPSSV